jgi:hypothetical protein
MDPETKSYCSFILRQASMALLATAVCLIVANAQGQPATKTPAGSKPIQARHVLGFEGEKRNAKGELSIKDGALDFQPNGGSAGQLNISFIQNVSVGEESRQVGGVPMMMGKAALPYGGGRIVSLFSHKKYDSVTFEYVDTNGGFHGAIFRLNKGQAEVLKEALQARRGEAAPQEHPVLAQKTTEATGDTAQQWSVQVGRIDPGETAVDACFSDAIYENVLEELAKSKQFKNVFRSGDRQASQTTGVLVLTTLVEKYSPGSETKRAVTTLGGATKLKVHIQLEKPDGSVLLERDLEGNVRFFGDNMRATSTLARKVAKAMNASALSGPVAPAGQQANESAAAQGRLSKSAL